MPSIIPAYSCTASLLGMDVLSGGKDNRHWNFAGLRVKTLTGGQVEASLMFEQGPREVSILLPHAPVAGDQPQLEGSCAMNFKAASPPLKGGQCLRHYLLRNMGEDAPGRGTEGEIS